MSDDELPDFSHCTTIYGATCKVRISAGGLRSFQPDTLYMYERSHKLDNLGKPYYKVYYDYDSELYDKKQCKATPMYPDTFHFHFHTTGA